MGFLPKGFLQSAGPEFYLPAISAACMVGALLIFTSARNRARWYYLVLAALIIDFNLYAAFAPITNPAKLESLIGRSMPADLASRQCQPCIPGSIAPLTAQQVKSYLAALPEWTLSEDGTRIRRQWRVKDFPAGLDLIVRIGQIAQVENHHPDLHLVRLRTVTAEIWTYALGGLSENDFILAAKIDALGS